MLTYFVSNFLNALFLKDLFCDDKKCQYVKSTNIHHQQDIENLLQDFKNSFAKIDKIYERK